MKVFKGICTDYVSDIDHLFHAPAKSPAPASKAKQREVSKNDQVAYLRDRPAVDQSVDQDASDLWEGF